LHVHPAPPPPTTIPREVPAPGPTPGPSRRERRGLVVTAAAVAAVIAVTTIALVVLPGGDSPNGSGNETETTPTPPPSSTTTAAVPPEWQRLPDLGVQLEAAGVAALDGEVWVVGGLTPGPGLRPALRDVQIYNPAQNNWRAGPKLPLPGGLDGAAVASDGKRLYAVGGRTGQDPNRVYRAEVWVLDGPDDPDWEHLTSSPQVRDGADVVGADHPDAVPLPAPRYAGAVAWDEAGQRLVFAGGSSEDGYEADIWEWREGGQWIDIGELTQARDDLAVATDGKGRVWFLGGNGGNGARHLDVVDRVEGDNVDPDSDIKIQKIRASAAVWLPERGVCLLGGMIPEGDGEVATDAVTCPGMQLPPLNPGRAGTGAVLLDDTIYVVGGFSGGEQGMNRVDALQIP
jgi:Kelch motif